MNKTLKIQLVKAILVSVFSIAYTIYLIEPDEEDIIESVRSFGIYVLLAIIAFSILWKAFVRLDETNKKTFWIIVSVLFFGLVATLAIDRGYAYYDTHSVKIRAWHKVDLGGCTVILRNDGRYKFENYFMIASGYTYGKYRMEDDTIYLSNNKPFGEDTAYESNKMIIKGDSIYFIRDNEKDDGFIFKIIPNN